MANKPLKTIKFPGLDDTYTIPQVDAALATSGAAADAKKVGDELTNLKQDLQEFPNGNYPNMTAGNADQLVSTVFIEDEVPYNFRTSGGSADIGDREYDEIVGVSMPINQFCPNDVMHVTGTSALDWNSVTSQSFNFSVITGHKYLFTFNGKTVSGGGLGVRDATEGVVFRPTPLSYAIIYGATVTSNGTTNVQGKWDAGTTDAYLNAFDLTLMLGTQIADYVYGLEQSTAGSGVTWLKHHFPKIFDSGYIPYNAGEMQSVSGLSLHRMTGFNQWDEEWRNGYYGVDGAFHSDSSYLCCANKISILPGTVYTQVSLSGGIGRICFYDANKAFLSTISGYASESATKVNFTTPSNAYYMTFDMKSVYGATYKNDICINLHWDGERDGQYEEYKEYEYALDDSVVLRGKLELDSNNNLRANGDRYLPDGTVDRRFGVYTITGGETWIQWGQAYYINALSLRAKDSNHTINCISDKLPGESSDALYSGNAGVAARGSAIYIDSASYSSLSSLTGMKVVYELATATTETAEPYQTPQIVDDWGTEEYVSTSLVPVGHDTKYANNLRAKLEMSPDSPEEDGDYIVRHNNGENQYVALGSTTTIQGILDRLTALENA